MELNSNQIAEILPHRYPFALVDRITDFEPGQWAKGIKCVSAAEPVFCGHFPQAHIFPGVLILEALAQVGAVAVLSEEENRGKIALFGGVKNARFRRQVIPGDVLELDGETLRIFNTPGHTWGSICILSEKSKVVFTGDTIFDTDLGRTDLSDGSPRDMKESCRNVIDKWSNEYTVYPGHDGSATMKQVRKYNQEFLDCLK